MPNEKSISKVTNFCPCFLYGSLGRVSVRPVGGTQCGHSVFYLGHHSTRTLTQTRTRTLTIDQCLNAVAFEGFDSAGLDAVFGIF